MASHSDDLDELLDSALDDFKSLDLTPPKRNVDSKTDENNQEKPSLPTNIQGLGLSLPDLKAKKKGKQKVDKEAHVSETLDKLRQQTKQTVKGLELMTAEVKDGLDSDDFSQEELENLVKQFEQLAGPQGMESFMETMMQQLLSKEILYEPMKEIAERYPKWLEEHKAGLSEEDYKRYSHQHEVIQELNVVYETDPENFTKIVELMQKMQEYGQLPNDIVHELAPGFDLSNHLEQLSTPEMQDIQQKCSIM